MVVKLDAAELAGICLFSEWNAKVELWDMSERLWEERWKILSFEMCLVETYFNRQCDITLLCGPLHSAAFASLDRRPVSWPDR